MSTIADKSNLVVVPERPKSGVVRGLLMLCVLWFAYIMFAANWVSGSILAPKIIDQFFGGPVAPVISQVVNYSITTARIIANLLAAMALMRMGPRKASILALSLLMFSVPAIWMPNFWGYTFARMIMALGGSMCIVYVNPIMANYIPKKYKIMANGFSVVTYNLGAFLTSLAFVFWADSLRLDWQLTMSVCAATTVIAFIAFLVVSEDFSTTKNVSEDAHSGEEVKYGYSDAVRDPFVWNFSLGFGVFLFYYILVVTSFPATFSKYVPNIDGALINMLVTGFCILGTVLGTWLGLSNRKRKPMMLFFGALSFIAFAYVLFIAPTSATQAYILAAVAGFFMFVHYPLYMNLAHEMKNMSAQKLTLIFGFLWGIGYATNTILTVIWSIILGAYGWNAASVFFIVMSATWLYFVSRLPETK